MGLNRRYRLEERKHTKHPQTPHNKQKVLYIVHSSHRPRRDTDRLRTFFNFNHLEVMKEKVLVSICLALLILVATSTPIMAEQIYWLRGVNPIAADKALVKEALAYKEAGNWDAWDAMANRKVFFFPGLPVRILQEDPDGMVLFQITVGSMQRPHWTVREELADVQP